MNRIFIFFLLFVILLAPKSIAGESVGFIQGNRISQTTVTYLATTGTLVKRGQGQIWNLAFQSTASNGSFYICDSVNSSCSFAGGVVAEGASSVSGNSYTQSYTNPLMITNGIYIVVTNGDLTITYN